MPAIVSRMRPCPSITPQVSEPEACNRTRADYPVEVSAPILGHGAKARAMHAHPNSVYAECYLGKWLWDGGVGWDTNRRPLLGPRHTCLYRTAKHDNCSIYNADAAYCTCCEGRGANGFEFKPGETSARAIRDEMARNQSVLTAHRLGNESVIRQILSYSSV